MHSYPYCTRLTKHALVWRFGESVSLHSPFSAVSEPSDTTIRVSTQEPQEPESSRLDPRATAIQKQGFYDQVVARIEAFQRHSPRSIYESKWSIL